MASTTPNQHFISATVPDRELEAKLLSTGMRISMSERRVPARTTLFMGRSLGRDYKEKFSVS